MPVKTKTSKTSKEAPVIRLGLMGSGELSPKSLKATYQELIASLDGTPHFVVPVTKDRFNDGVKAVVDMLLENDVPYDAVTTPEAAKVRNLKPYLSNAASTVERQRGYNKFFVQTIGDNGKLLVLFDADDELLEETMQYAFEAEIPVLSFTQGLDELESADDDDTADEDDEAAETEEADDDDVDDDDDAEPVSKTNGVGDLASALRIIGQSLIDASKGL